MKCLSRSRDRLRIAFKSIRLSFFPSTTGSDAPLFTEKWVWVGPSITNNESSWHLLPPYRRLNMVITHWSPATAPCLIRCGHYPSVRPTMRISSDFTITYGLIRFWHHGCLCKCPDIPSLDCRHRWSSWRCTPGIGHWYEVWISLP